ncbi:STAT2 protein, partial [Sterrhoptilus dennistouni]|nr:STAT2 protein [Sterrhoptilus dennistouni]
PQAKDPKQEQLGLNRSRETPGTTQDRAGAEGTPRSRGDPWDHPGPSRSRGTPGTTRKRAGAEGTPGSRGDPRDHPGAEGTPWSTQDHPGPPGAETPSPPVPEAGTCGGSAIPSRFFLSSVPAVAGGLLGPALTPSPPSMAQWQEVQNLANTYLEQVHQLYAGSALPMAVRQSLAAWIESQNWRQAAEPLSSHAPMLFHSLLVLLEESLGSLGSGYEDFMLKHNLRKAHRDLQAEFGKKPERFANLVANLLQEERRILRLGQAGG